MSNASIKVEMLRFDAFRERYAEQWQVIETGYDINGFKFPDGGCFNDVAHAMQFIDAIKRTEPTRKHKWRVVSVEVLSEIGV